MAEQSMTVKILNEADTKKMFKTDFPNYARFAVANTAVKVAFLGVEKAETEIRHDFNLKNKFVVGTSPGKGAVKFTGHRDVKPHHDLRKIISSWGSPAKYDFMEKQEEGFTHKGMIPYAKNARTSGSINRPIKGKAKRFHLEIMSNRGMSGNTAKLRTMVLLREAYKNNYGLPGTKQYFYLSKGDFGIWGEGLYQFKKSNPTAGNLFPNLKQVYSNKPDDNRKRKATHWMEDSKNRITQAEVDRIFNIEAKRSFTKQITTMHK